jgi:shikimate kinase
MQIGLLGMSGIGKTYWANRLTQSGFECFHCDDLIAAQLQLQVGQTLNTVYDLGAWMGLPDEAGFGDRERQYLDVEEQTLAQITDRLTHRALPANNLVVDMTGSAIYADAETLAKLRRCVRFVYLAITPAVQAQMLAEYIRRPRPLIWSGLFQQEPDEERAAALQRCFGNLIAYREAKYERLCDVKLEYSFHRQASLTVANFLQAIRQVAR